MRFSSPTTKGKTGTFNFADTGVSLSLYSYAPLSNTETRVSIAPERRSIGLPAPDQRIAPLALRVVRVARQRAATWL